MSNPRFGRRSHHSRALPVAPARIIGREREIDQLYHLLADTGARLVALTGPGGVGKTRLALEVALQTEDLFADGVWWVDLAPVCDADLALATIASSLGLEENGDQPLITTVRNGLRDHQALLVLDNTEQVRDIATLVAELVAWCPALSILSTGRSPLDVRAEQRYPVEPLPVPAPDPNLASGQRAVSPAVALFIERVQAVDPTFHIDDSNTAEVLDICGRLDGLPLAIELAAAQVGTLGLAPLLDRLDGHLPLICTGARDLPSRQQTVERAIAWSHDLLTPDERNMLHRLAVCAGGFTLEAATAILEASADDGHTIDGVSGVSALVCQSLLRREADVAGESRFRMLELTRAFALNRLATSDDADAVRRRHAHYFLHLVQQAEAEIAGPDAETWLRRLAVEHDNLRTALAWALESGEVMLAAQLAAPLAPFWYVGGHLREGRTWLERIVSALGETQRVERVAVLGALGTLAAAQGDGLEEARLADEGLRLARALGDEPTIAKSLHRRGNAARGRSNFAEAGRYYEDALALFQQIGDRARAAAALNNLGIVAADQGDMHRSRRLLEDARRIYQDLGNQRGMAITLCNLGQRVAAADGTLAALPYYQQALPLFRTVGDAAGIAWSLQAVALLAAEDGALTQAARLYGSAEAHREAIGWHFSARERQEYDEGVVVLREQMSERTFRDAWAAGRDLTAEQAMAKASAALDATRSSGTSDRPPGGLTEREVDVLCLIADGLTNSEIAHRLDLSPHTVDAHLRRIYRKLEVRSRSAASRFAVEHGLV